MRQTMRVEGRAPNGDCYVRNPAGEKITLKGSRNNSHVWEGAHVQVDRQYGDYGNGNTATKRWCKD